MMEFNNELYMCDGFGVSCIGSISESRPIDNTAQRVPRAYLSPRIRQVRYGVRSQKERFRGTRSIIVRLSFRSQHTFFPVS